MARVRVRGKDRAALKAEGTKAEAVPRAPEERIEPEAGHYSFRQSWQRQRLNGKTAVSRVSPSAKRHCKP